MNGVSGANDGEFHVNKSRMSCKSNGIPSIRPIRIIDTSVCGSHFLCSRRRWSVVDVLPTQMAKFAVLLVLVCIMVDLPEAGKVSRRKRYLVYPKPGSKVQFIVGTGVPIPLENHAITMGWVVKSQYLLPTNASQYTDSYVTFQKRSTERRASRYDFYRTFEHAASSFGGGGKECMLRTICEASRIPLKASGLIGQVLRIFLSPSSTDEIPLTASDGEYHRAELLGQEKDVNCQSLYPSCSFTLVDLLTVIV